MKCWYIILDFVLALTDFRPDGEVYHGSWGDLNVIETLKSKDNQIERELFRAIGKK